MKVFTKTTQLCHRVLRSKSLPFGGRRCEPEVGGHHVSRTQPNCVVVSSGRGVSPSMAYSVGPTWEVTPSTTHNGWAIFMKTFT